MTRRTPRTRAGAATLAVLALTACAPDTPSGSEPSPTPERTAAMTAPDPAPATSGTPAQPPAEAGTAVLLTIGDTTVPGQLWDNPAARDLAARLPLTLTFADYGGVEKTAALDPPIPMDGMPAGDDPNPGEIGWYAPASVVVLYYEDVASFPGIARLGTFDDDGIALLADGPGAVTVTIAAAGR